MLITATCVYGIARSRAANTSRRAVPDGRPIACLGDSLTDSGCHQELAKLLLVPVADFGVDGIDTEDGIKLAPTILAANPQLVIIELGGHDYNTHHKTRSETRSRLAALTETFLDEGIAVVLVEIPRGFISDPYDGIERELAAEYDMQLIDDSMIRCFVLNGPIIRPGVWLDPSLRYSDDGLHANRRGNEYFAKIVSQAIVKVLGESILQ